MPRTYALALIFAAVTLIGGLFYGQYRFLTDGRVEVAAYAEGVYERVVAGQLDQMERLAHQANERMQDDINYRFRPITAFLDKSFERRDIYLKRAQQEGRVDESKSITFSCFHDAELDSLLKSYNSLLLEFGHEMDLSKDDVTSKIAHIKKMIAKARITPGTVRPSEGVFARSLLAADYLNTVGLIARDAVGISEGRTICGGEWYFPVYSAKEGSPKKGIKTTAKVAIGSYFTALNPDNVLLVAGGDTLTFNPDGTADYEFVPQKRGNHTVELYFEITNPLTGEVKSGEGVYTYYIR